MGQLGLSGLGILGSSYNDRVQGWELRGKEISVLDRSWGGEGSSGDEVVEVLIVGMGRVGCKGLICGPIR